MSARLVSWLDRNGAQLGSAVDRMAVGFLIAAGLLSLVVWLLLMIKR